MREKYYWLTENKRLKAQANKLLISEQEQGCTKKLG
jgi:hypothetical protein